MKKKCCLFLSLAASVSLFSGCITEIETAPSQESSSAVIVFTNDIHCGVGQAAGEDGAVTNIGYAGLSAVADEMEALYGPENVTLVDAGDAVQGDAIGTMSKGEYIIDIMNQVGVDVFAPGNHEFDYGMEQMQALMGEVEGNVISANFTDLSTGETVFAPYTIVTYDEFSIGFVGLTTPESFTKSTPAYFQDENGEFVYSFRQGNDGADLYAAAQEAVDAAVAEGADFVIGVGHLGIDEQSAPWRSTDVIANTTGFDAFIDGHSHSEIPGELVDNADGEDVLLVQTGTKLANVGTLIISADGTMEAELITGYADLDLETDEFVAAIESEFEADLAEVVGETAVDLTVNNPETGERVVRNGETNLGDLAADAYRFVLGNGKTGEEAGPADVAFVNGGGVRADIAAGEMSFGEVIAVHPFNNVGCVVEATGQEILDALEMASNSAPAENGGFLQVSGVNYTIDLSVPSSVVMDDMRSFVSVEGDRRVKDATIGGQPIDPEAVYTVASHNYMLLDGGDGINMFRDNNVVVQPVILDNQILITYIESFLDGVVGEDYANPAGQGRITIVGE